MEVYTYNNGTVSVDNPDPYMSLVLYDDSVDYQLDEDELIFYANVSLEPHSTATLIINARVRDESWVKIGFELVTNFVWRTLILSDETQLFCRCGLCWALREPGRFG